MPAQTSDRTLFCRPDGSLLRQLARRAAVFLCALLATGGALELHNLANHHRAIETGGVLETGASHPRIPHHFDRSEEQREPACATCVLQAQARGIQPGANRTSAPTGFKQLDSTPATSSAASALPASASPRGPPAA